MKTEHVIFLIHPCCYETLDAETIRRDNLYLFLERERETKQRWLDALAERPTNTLLVQLGGPEYLRDAAVECLGEPAVLYPRSPFSQNRDLAEYYRRLACEFRAHLATHALEFDAGAVTSELWGESFEGCVPGYGGAFAQYLGLRRPPRMRFEMTVYDSRFLHGARRWESIRIGNSDVEAWLFECHDGTGAAIFQSRLSAQWMDGRRVWMRLDDRRLQVCTKLGHTVWPQQPWTKGRPEGVRDFSMALSECINRWVRSVGMTIDDFREVIRAARVEEATDRSAEPAQ